MGGIDRHFGQVADVNRLQRVVPFAGNAEGGEFAQHPGDVVEEDAFAAEEDGGAKDGVGKAGFADQALRFPLCPEA